LLRRTRDGHGGSCGDASAPAHLDDRIEIRTEESLDIRQYVHARKIDTILLDYSEEIVVVMERFVSAEFEIGFVVANQTTFAICWLASLDCPSYGDTNYNAESDSCYGTLGSQPAEMARILRVLDTLEEIEMLWPGNQPCYEKAWMVPGLM